MKRSRDSRDTTKKFFPHVTEELKVRAERLESESSLPAKLDSSPITSGKLSTEALEVGSKEKQILPMQPRQLILEAAGIDLEELGQITRDNVERLKELTRSTKTQYYAHEGIVRDKREIVENRTSLEAVKALNDFVGAMPSRNGNTGAAKVQIEIVLPDWAQPIDVTPQKDKT